MKLSNGAVAGISVIVLLFMLGLGMAAKPLYGTFCRVTGYGGTTRIATAPPKEVLDNTMMVRFDTNVADTPLIFRALQPDQEVHIGQNSLAFFEVTNPTDREIHVIAAYNVTPHYAGLYFNKLECFCLTNASSRRTKRGSCRWSTSSRLTSWTTGSRSSSKPSR